MSGNMIDLTHELDIPSGERTGIYVQCSDVVVSDNQVYVRGETDPRTTGIVVDGAAANVTVHDNIVRHCGRGFVTTRAGSTVEKVLGPGRFLAGLEIEKQWAYSHRYRGWFVHWLDGKHAGTVVAFDGFDAKTVEFKLAEPLRISEGERFGYYPGQANWMIHHNIVEGCTEPVVLDSYGSDTSLFTDNLIGRGLATGVRAAVVLKGNIAVECNRIVGFDEEGAVGIAVHPDPLGTLWDKNCANNTVCSCSRDAVVVRE